MSSNNGKDDSTNSFGRRTWDRDEYLKRAQERYESRNKAQDNEEDTKMSKHAFHKGREQVFHKIDEMNKVSFVSEQLSAVTGKRGKGIGFYCEICNLTYKDDLELVDHLNSKQHYHNAGVEYIDKRDITLEMVVDRVEKLASERERKEMESDEKFDLKRRIEMRRRFEEALAEKRKLKRIKRKLKRHALALHKPGDDNDNDNDVMMKKMGFHGFGTTKLV